MVADLCLLKGWAVDFLGANTPTTAVVEMAKRRNAHLVALSVTMEQGMTHVQRLLDELAALSPAPNVVLGGQLFAANPLPVSLQRGCVIARDATDGIELIGKLLRADRPKAVLKEYLLVLARRVRELRRRKVGPRNNCPKLPGSPVSASSPSKAANKTFRWIYLSASAMPWP